MIKLVNIKRFLMQFWRELAVISCLFALVVLAFEFAIWPAIVYLFLAWKGK